MPGGCGSANFHGEFFTRQPVYSTDGEQPLKSFAQVRAAKISISSIIQQFPEAPTGSSFVSICVRIAYAATRSMGPGRFCQNRKGKRTLAEPLQFTVDHRTHFWHLRQFLFPISLCGPSCARSPSSRHNQFLSSNDPRPPTI